MKLPIRYYGDPVLRKKCAPIEEITPEIRKLAQDMIETLDKLNAQGLAACQVGHSIRMFVLRNYVENPDGSWSVSDPVVFINPKIISHSKETIKDREGCMSIPGLRGVVERPLKATVEALDLDGKVFVEDSEGYNARCRFHENDHINGVLYVDRLDVHERKRLEPYLQAIKKKYFPSEK